MQKHIQAVFALTAFQILCLGLGLWIQDRILISTAAWDQRHASSGARLTTISTEPRKSFSAQTVLIPESILRIMPTVRVVTLVWVSGLQFVAIFLVITRLRPEDSRRDQKSEIRLLRREKDLVRTRNAVIFGLASLAESRDRETGQHLDRIALYSTRLATALRSRPPFRHQISSSFIKAIGISSVLHDIGKVGVPDAILLKPSYLTDDERKQMQQHTIIGSECIERIERRLGNSNFLQMARQIALHHHEHWDGGGYPHQFAGEAIPLAARIVAVADIYDALSVKRVYKDAFPHEQCVEIIHEYAGAQLDPAIVDVFLSIEHEFESIAKQFSDASETISSASSEPEERSEREILSTEDELMESMFEFEQTLEHALAGAR